MRMVYGAQFHIGSIHGPSGIIVAVVFSCSVISYRYDFVVTLPPGWTVLGYVSLTCAHVCTYVVVRANSQIDKYAYTHESKRFQIY